MTGLRHFACGRVLPNQPTVERDARGRFLRAWCNDCQVGQTVRHVRQLWGVETITREIRPSAPAVTS